MTKIMNLTAVIITRNEASRIAACIQSAAFCGRVVVLDSASSDDTALVARNAGAEVFLRTFDDFASQKNHAMALATTEWVLSIDADEIVSEPLRAKITAILSARSGNPSASAYAIRRVNRIFGRVMKYGAQKSDYPVRLFRRTCGRFEGAVHESFRVEATAGKIQKIDEPLIHNSTATVADYMRKFHAYVPLEAKKISRGVKAGDLWLRPGGRFLKDYVLRMGFMDGREGFIFAILSGYYEFARYALAWEKSKS